ncbi:unnamed protein product [Heligmosomoides polygyrus]|uniref:SH2_2 domain-containing protein n=1 Tax=Heligmosomoides polygyrus TaxID=6339 RepID=A0A183G8G1_HELPZ|nr:unnamed protein product [Heligmosomoides polygyrus]
MQVIDLDIGTNPRHKKKGKHRKHKERRAEEDEYRVKDSDSSTKARDVRKRDDDDIDSFKKEDEDRRDDRPKKKRRSSRIRGAEMTDEEKARLIEKAFRKAAKQRYRLDRSRSESHSPVESTREKRDKDRDRDRDRDRERDRDRDTSKDRATKRDRDTSRDRDTKRDRDANRERDANRDRDIDRDREMGSDSSRAVRKNRGDKIDSSRSLSAKCEVDDLEGSAGSRSKKKKHREKAIREKRDARDEPANERGILESIRNIMPSEEKPKAVPPQERSRAKPAAKTPPIAHQQIPGLARSVYIGVCNFAKAEEKVTKRSDFRLYHQMAHRPLLDDLEQELPLIVVYRTANGSFRHYPIRRRKVGSSVYYYVDYGDPQVQAHASLDHLVRYYQINAQRHPENGEYADQFPWWEVHL